MQTTTTQISIAKTSGPNSQSSLSTATTWQGAQASPWEAQVGDEEQLFRNAVLQGRGCVEWLLELPPQRLSTPGWTEPDLVSAFMQEIELRDLQNEQSTG